MIILHTQDGTIAAAGEGILETADEFIVNGDAHWGKHLGVRLADVLDASLPADFSVGGYLFDGVTFARRPLPAPEREALVLYFDGVVQGRIDGVARAFGYGDPHRPEVSPILHAVSYADEPAVLRFQQEGQALRAWRSRTWAKAAEILNAVKAGTRAIPTEVELLDELETAAPAPIQAP